MIDIVFKNFMSIMKKLKWKCQIRQLDVNQII